MSQDCNVGRVIKTFVSNTGKLLVDIPYYIYLFTCTVLATLSQIFTRRKLKDLNNETILITGAASGLGQQVVVKLAKISKEAVFVLWDINENGLKETAEKCKGLGALNVYTYVVDLSSYNDVVQTANLVRSQVGKVTTLFNNAGLSPYILFQDSNSETEEKVLRVNLLSHMWTIREFLPDMIKNGRGHLVSTCSGLAFHKFPFLTSYVASKYGLRGFIEALKMEMDTQSCIKFTIIYPGWVKTGMTSGVTWEPRYQFDVLTQLCPEYVSEQMVKGILREEEQVFIPSTLKYTIFLFGCLPASFKSRMDKHLFRNVRLKNDTFTV